MRKYFLLACFTLAMAASSRAVKDTVFQSMFDGYESGKAPWMCPHEICPRQGHTFASKQNWEKHVTALQSHTYCYLVGCAACSKLEDAELFHGTRPAPIEGGVEYGHTDCGRTFTKTNTSGKSHHLKDHVKCKRDCPLCAKRPAEQPPGM